MRDAGWPEYQEKTMRLEVGLEKWSKCLAIF